MSSEESMSQARHGGGWQAIRYALRAAVRLGPVRFYRAMAAKNACKTCAFGMGGQKGGMRNEAGRFPEVCKKSMQAMAADMAGRIQPRLFETYTVGEFKSFTSREMEAFGRLADPVILRPGDDRYRPIAWDEALALVAGSLKTTPPERAFFYASGRSSNEAGFLLQLFARVYGTNHVNNCSYYCHQASGAGLKDSIGTPTATIELDDLEKCDLLFLIGGNPASNHPRLMTMLMRLRRRGGKVIVVNPILETGLVAFKVPSNLKSMLSADEVASIYLQPKIGGDIAFLAGMAKRLIAIGAIDHSFIEMSTSGFEAVRILASGLSWEEIEESSGLSRSEIEEAADAYASSERTVFAWTMGITHHEHGTDNVQWIVNLALMRGMIGKEGAGVLPIRGHSNVQGIGSVGVSPALTKAAIEGLAALGVQAPAFKGHDTMAAMEACARGEMDFGLCLGGNLFGANPDASFASSALARLDLLVYLNTSLNTGHAHGLAKTTLVLPVLARDEEQQSTTQESMFNYVRLSDGGKPRFSGPWSETAILSEIAARWRG
ncbi:MAG TPA: molybdopterin-dependent oxidoreductase, partial [Fimbriimonadaceae bacterium]|nr:molybdopterin-dependent oxidoreductase [Fimbriimonadaceae bacterium]